MKITKCSQQTFTERQCEFVQRTESKSLIPVIVPMYLKEKKNKTKKLPLK